MGFDVVVWDFNGTLVDDVERSCYAINRMSADFGLDCITVSEYRSQVAKKLWRILSDLAGDLREIRDRFDAYYSEYEGNDVFRNGALDLLDYLKARGIRQILKSDTTQEYLDSYVRDSNLSHYFEKILGFRDEGFKRRYERIRSIIGSDEVTELNVLWLGDTNGDYNLSEKLGFECILLSNGHVSEEILLESDALVMDSLTDVLDLLRTKSSCVPLR